jgi:hypothetical protein
MSEWDQYKITSKSQPNLKNEWDQYKIVSKPKGDSWPELIGKSVGKGVTSIADLPKLAGSALEGYTNSWRQALSPLKPELSTPTNYSASIPGGPELRQGIKNYTGLNLEPKPQTGAQRIASHAGEFAGSLATLPIGAAAKAPGYLNSAYQGLKRLGTGAAIGGTSGTLQEAGVNPLVADIGSSIVAPSVASKGIGGAKALITSPKETLAKAPIKLMGLSPKRINVEAGTAAQDLGIDLPAAALTDSTLTGLADQWIQKTPFFGNKLKQKYATTQEQTKNALEDIYKNIGPNRTPEVENQITKLYADRIKSLPEGAAIKPVHLEKAIDSIKIKSALPSDAEKDLLQSLKTLKNEIKPTSTVVTSPGIPPIKMSLQEFPIERLIDTKRSLNARIKWDADEGVKNLLRRMQTGISRDIAEYGKTNQEWYKTFKEADKLFGDVAKREKIENLLGVKATNFASDNVGYNTLAKTINTPKNLEIIRNQVNPETFEKIKKLGTVSKAMAIKSMNIPNPSGTAATAATIGLVSGLYANPIGVLSGSGIGAVLGAHVASNLLTNKKFLDLSLKLARQPQNPRLANAVSNQIKDLTGYTAVALQNAVNKGNATNREGE